jgi:hypothetical protein
MENLKVKTDQFISLDKAKQLLGKFKKDKDKVLKDEFKGKNILPYSETFELGPIKTLMDLPNCAGLRIYFGMEEDDNVSLVIVGVDQDGADILEPVTLSALSLEGGTEEVTTDPIVENGTKCPPTCPVTSTLNS